MQADVNGNHCDHSHWYSHDCIVYLERSFIQKPNDCLWNDEHICYSISGFSCFPHWCQSGCYSWWQLHPVWWYSSQQSRWVSKYFAKDYRDELLSWAMFVCTFNQHIESMSFCSYNPDTGVFTIPWDGLYHLGVSLLVEAAEYVRFRMWKNDEVQCSAAGDLGIQNYTSVYCSAVVESVAGE